LGIALEGATLRQDLDDNPTLYGKRLENREIVTKGVRPPKAAARLLELLTRRSTRTPAGGAPRFPRRSWAPLISPITSAASCAAGFSPEHEGYHAVARAAPPPSPDLTHDERARSLPLTSCRSLEGYEMNAIRIVAIVLIAAGVLGLAYGSFTYTKETHEAKLGTLELSVKDRETVNIPVWAGVGAIAIGGALLLVGGRKNS
jgi:hypothetical protein